MRLIDVHKLQKAIHLHSSQKYISKDKVLEYCKEQPTVKAIPIEWIRQYIHSIGGSNGLTKLHKEILKTMVKDWEKENDTPD